MAFRRDVATPMPILVVTSGPHHGDIGSGIGQQGREAKSITQYRIVFVSLWGRLTGTARSPGSGPSSSLGWEVLLRRPRSMLRPRYADILELMTIL